MRMKCSCVICASHEAGIHTMAVVEVDTRSIAYRAGEAKAAADLTFLFLMIGMAIIAIVPFAILCFGV